MAYRPLATGVTPILLGALACSDPGPVVRTVALSHPEDTVSAFEPFTVIDHASPGRIYVGAQYGAGYNRGGMRIWTWSSPDGGGSWSQTRVVPKAFPPAGHTSQSIPALLTGQLIAAVRPVGPDELMLTLPTQSAPRLRLSA